MTIDRLTAALAGRYTLERELGPGGNGHRLDGTEPVM